MNTLNEWLCHRVVFPLAEFLQRATGWSKWHWSLIAWGTWMIAEAACGTLLSVGILFLLIGPLDLPLLRYSAKRAETDTPTQGALPLELYKAYNAAVASLYVVGINTSLALIFINVVTFAPARVDESGSPWWMLSLGGVWLFRAIAFDFMLAPDIAKEERYFERQLTPQEAS